jgi:hypothetical protein
MKRFVEGTDRQAAKRMTRRSNVSFVCRLAEREIPEWCHPRKSAQKDQGPAPFRFGANSRHTASMFGGEVVLGGSGKSEIKTPDQLKRLDDGRLLNRCLSFPASDSSQSRKVTIFGRFAVALGQTIQ